MESGQTKALVIAHFIEHGMRENYSYEKMKAAGEKDKGVKPPPASLPPSWSRHFGRGGLGAGE